MGGGLSDGPTIWGKKRGYPQCLDKMIKVEQKCKLSWSNWDFGQQNDLMVAIPIMKYVFVLIDYKIFLIF